MFMQATTTLVALSLAVSAQADGVRVSAGGGPPLAVDLLYADQFPAANSLRLVSPVNVRSWLDVTWNDGDDTNARLGDSATVVAPGAGVRVFLNFRVYPGPGDFDVDPFFDRYGGDFMMPGGSWAEARMDTAEVASGPVAAAWATYLHEAAGGVEGDDVYKLIPDGVLKPGATVEYFFTADTGVGTAQTVSPDTSGGFYLEWQALPGYFEAEGAFLSPCVLYVDAFNQGAQVFIEDLGLAPYLGAEIDDDGVVHEAWDRFDYRTEASGAPMAREPAGDNGLTQFQSLIYRTILYNTGTSEAGAIRNRDARLLHRWLTIDDFGRGDIPKGLWLSGDNIATMLSEPGAPDMTFLLSGFAGAALVCDRYGDPGCGGGADGDLSACARLDPTPETIGIGSTYAAVSGSGRQDVLDTVGDGVGDLVYVDQDDAGQPATEFASVYGDAFDTSLSWGVVLDAFSLHKLRLVPSDFADESCGADLSAVTQRVIDVFAWMDVFPGAICSPCEFCVDCCVTGVDPPATPAVTVLLPNAPNPFNPITDIHYVLGESARVSLRIYDAAGALVRTLVNEPRSAGRFSVRWDGADDAGRPLSSGVFFARMETSSGYRASTKLVLVK